MAKNLKLQIKNNQLAAVLKQNKVKQKEDEKKKDPPFVPPAPSKKPQSSSSRVVGKARSAPAAMLEKNAAAEKGEKNKEAESRDVSSSASVDTTLVSPETIPPETIPPQKEDGDTPVSSPEKEETAPTSEAAKNTDPLVQTEKKPVTSVKEEKPTKDIKSLKKQAFQQTFDSRDRYGLRANEEESWRRKRHSKNRHKKSIDLDARPKALSIQPPISLKDLAASMKIKSTEIMEKLFRQGLTVTINDTLDDDTLIGLIGDEFNCKISIDRSIEKRLRVTEMSIKEEITSTDSNKLIHKAPVVAFMGHVDHGKTSLIDAIRKSKLAAAEAGAITQHIGAFRCHTKHGDITILDTPGHEAFTAIRSRGAEVTDIIVIVIAGDEGIMPQTDEAIQQARDAQVPMIVAINKSDKPAFNADNVLRQLADRDMLAEAWGGELITVNCSATSHAGIEELLEMLALQSEILELKANPSTRARGTVLESQIHKGLGITATLLVQNGTLHRNDPLLFEHEYGRVKTMKDERGKNLHKALPSQAVEITGLSSIPPAGCEFIVVKNEREAKKLAQDRAAGEKRTNLNKSQTADLEMLIQQQTQKKEQKIFPVILKADVKGSLEAIESMLLSIPSNKAKVQIISSAVGEIAESDIEWAKASGVTVIGFHTQVTAAADELARRLNVKVMTHEIIYHLVDEVKVEMTQLLDKVRHETEAGIAEVRMVFKSSHLGTIAGCHVTDGSIKRSHIVKIFRDRECVWEGNIASLKRHQDDVKEVGKGLECGILLVNFSDVKEGDVIHSYEVSYLTQTL